MRATNRPKYRCRSADRSIVAMHDAGWDGTDMRDYGPDHGHCETRGNTVWPEPDDVVLYVQCDGEWSTVTRKGVVGFRP